MSLGLLYFIRLLFFFYMMIYYGFRWKITPLSSFIYSSFFFRFLTLTYSPSRSSKAAAVRQARYLNHLLIALQTLKNCLVMTHWKMRPIVTECLQANGCSRIPPHLCWRNPVVVCPSHLFKSPHVHPQRHRVCSPRRGTAVVAAAMVRNSLKMSKRCFSSMGRLLYVYADIYGPITLQSVLSCWTVRLWC